LFSAALGSVKTFAVSSLALLRSFPPARLT
jgi:hypothetical protein